MEKGYARGHGKGIRQRQQRELACIGGAWIYDFGLFESEGRDEIADRHFCFLPTFTTFAASSAE